MFYIYTLIIPILIILLGIWLKGVKFKEIPNLVNILFQMIPHLFGYAFLIFFLGIVMILYHSSMTKYIC